MEQNDQSECKALHKELEELKAKYNSLINYLNINEEQVKLVESRLTDSQNRNQALLNANPDIMFVFDKNGVISDFHSKNLRDLYVQPSSFLNKSVDEVLPERLAKLTHTKIEELIKSSAHISTYDYELTVDNKNKFFESRLVKYGSDKVIAIVRDVTQKRLVEHSLRESQAKYHDLYSLLRLMSDTTPDMIWAKDINKQYIFTNKSTCEKLLNVKNTNEPIGKTYLSFKQHEQELHPENPEWYTFGELSIDTDEATLQSKQILQFDEFGTINGKFHFLDIHKAPLYNSQGKLIGLVGTARDITEKKEIQKQLTLSEKTFRGIINSIYEAIYIMDQQGIFLDVNEAAVKLYGYPREFFIGKKPSMISAPGKNDMEYVIGLLKKSYNGETILFEFWGQKKNGEIFPKTVSLTPGEFFGKKCVIAVARNITEQKKWEEELIAARLKAEESDKLKSAFLANMSHEIRTPMNGIMGFTQLLKRDNVSDNEKNEYLNIIERSGERMLDLLDNLIDISRVEAGQVSAKMEKCNVLQILEFIHKFFLPLAERKALTFELKSNISNSEIEIVTDKYKLQGILLNLAKNAFKFTDKGYVKISCQKKNNSLEFVVSDSGIGIPNDKHDEVFQRFAQVDSSTCSNYEGAGLGLSIAKAYVNLLGGNIWVESELGKGSTFHFTLPISKPQYATTE